MKETEPRGFFLDRYGLDLGELENVLGTAVARRADHADLFFEFSTVESLQLEESMVKKATRNVSQGVGVRVVAADRTGYAYSDEVTIDRLRGAAETAHDRRRRKPSRPGSRFAAAARPRPLPIGEAPTRRGAPRQDGALERDRRRSAPLRSAHQERTRLARLRAEDRLSHDGRRHRRE